MSIDVYSSVCICIAKGLSLLLFAKGLLLKVSLILEQLYCCCYYILLLLVLYYYVLLLLLALILSLFYAA